MEIKVELEDEGLCAGCPFENGRKACKAGFVREIARIAEGSHEYHTIFGTYHEERRLGFSLVRPLSCVLASERAVKAAGSVPVAPARGAEITATEVAEHQARPRVKRVFLCSRCGSGHKNWEPCGPRGKR